jgi:hypothetical protein
MKRILILVTMILCSLAPAAWARTRCYYSNRGYIRYSPYAFRFGHNGLVPDTYRYSPYTGGLEHETVRYSPYAFNAYHNGLVSDAAGHYTPMVGSVYLHDMALRYQLLNAMGQLRQSIQQLQGNRYNVALHKPGHVRYAQARMLTPQKESARADQQRLVRRHLQYTIPGQYHITRVLRIDNETVSFDVVLNQSDTVIKLWNPEKIESLRAQKGRKQKFLDRYVQTWARFANEHERKGGAIYHISSSDSEQVIAKLTTCTDLEPGQMLAKR